jgi:crotonobetainyl-CoA:carnitine CoA-transferase CaiB-like acyl-CoA transferase
VGAVVGLDDALRSEHVKHREMVVSVETADGPLYLLGNPIQFDEPTDYRPPPTLHEHNSDLGL